MKKVLLMNVMMAAFTAIAWANNDLIPVTVINEFRKKFGVDIAVRWEKINEPDNYRYMYVGHFIQNGIWSEAFFEETGEYVGVGKNITALQLPAKVQSWQHDKYKGYAIMEVYEYLPKDEIIPVYGLVITNRNRMILLKINESGIFSVLRKEKYKN